MKERISQKEVAVEIVKEKERFSVFLSTRRGWWVRTKNKFRKKQNREQAREPLIVNEEKPSCERGSIPLPKTELTNHRFKASPLKLVSKPPPLQHSRQRLLTLPIIFSCSRTLKLNKTKKILFLTQSTPSTKKLISYQFTVTTF